MSGMETNKGSSSASGILWIVFRFLMRSLLYLTEATIVVVAVGAILVGLYVSHGRRAFDRETTAIVDRLFDTCNHGHLRSSGDEEKSRTSINRSVFEGLPPVVKRYFHVALQSDGDEDILFEERIPRLTKIRGLIVKQTGTFQGGSPLAFSHGHRDFNATQCYSTSAARPGFVWTGDVSPGVKAYDAYLEGKGLQQAIAYGAFTMWQDEQSRAITYSLGNLNRWIAEAVLFPVSLLPGLHSNGIRWKTINDGRALLEFNDESSSLGNLFNDDEPSSSDKLPGVNHLGTHVWIYFSDDGLIDKISGFGMLDQGRYEPGVWVYSFGNYELHDGMMVPMRLEKLLQTDRGQEPERYFTADINSLRYFDGCPHCKTH